jgi:hypothetical protein
MTLDSARQVRLRIQDTPSVFDETRTFDGSATVFNLPYRQITSATAFVPDASGRWSATGATFDPSGWVAFSGVGSASSAYRVRGVQSVFSDEEIGHFTAVGGSVAGAALEAVRALMFDGLKRAQWAAPDGSQWDDTDALEQLRALHDQLRDEVTREQAGGEFVSWAEGQGDWT